MVSKTMKESTKTIVSLTLLGLLLCACGLSDEPPKDSGVYNIEELDSSCELNTKALKNILTHDISADINCIEDQLNQFIVLVRQEDPNYISESNLVKFIGKFFPESKSMAKDLLSMVYDLNSLLLRDPKGKLSTSKLGDFFSIVKAVNTEGRYLYQLITNLKGKSYWARKQSIYKATQAAALRILTIITPYREENRIDRELNIPDFLTNLDRVFDHADKGVAPHKLESYLFAKKLLFGGEAQIVTSLETIDLFERASELSTLFLDALYSLDKDFSSKNEEHLFFHELVKSLGDQLSPFSHDEPILIHQDLLTLAQDIFSDKYNIQNIEQSLLKIKEKFLGGNPENYSFGDIKKVISWATELTGMLYFNDLSYDFYRARLGSPNAITDLPFPDIDAYALFSNESKNKYWHQFNYISSHYRFYYDTENRLHFFNSYKRFKSGLNKTSLLRWIIGKVIDAYGEVPVGKEFVELGERTLRNALHDLEGLLREVGFWPRDSERFISEAIASSDLFMFHSDGSGSSNTEEITEYALNIIHSFNVTDQVHQELAKKCGVASDGESISIPCFRAQFLGVFFKKLNFGRYYDKLYDYYKESNINEFKQYLTNIELYGRINPDETVPLTKEDLGRILVILGNLESAFIKFDKDRDGVLSQIELDATFLVFENLLKNITSTKLEIDPDDLSSGLYRSLFFYLIKKMQLPSASKLLFFHSFGRKKKITSTRYNISAILKQFIIQ